jgi:hypothetical protein
MNPNNDETRKYKFIKPNSKKFEFLNPTMTNKMKDILKAPKIKLFRDVKGKICINF